MKYSFLIILLLAGCRTAPKECTLELIRNRYPVEMREAFKDYPGLMMALFKDIADLEEETKHGYR